MTLPRVSLAFPPAVWAGPNYSGKLWLVQVGCALWEFDMERKE